MGLAGASSLSSQLRGRGSDSALRPVNLDITAMVVKRLGTLPALRELRPALVAAVGEGYGAHLDSLEAYAQAAGRARAGYPIAATPAPRRDGPVRRARHPAARSYGASRNVL